MRIRQQRAVPFFDAKRGATDYEFGSDAEAGVVVETKAERPTSA